MDIIENDLDEIASLLKKQKAHHTLKSLMTVCLNLIEHPKDERMRTLRTTNPTVARTLLAFPEARIFFETAWIY
jgi:plasmid stabilization system protein ParE